MATDTNLPKGMTIQLEDGLEFNDLDRLQDSVWYDGHVFTVTDNETDKSISIEARGEVRIHDSRKKYEGNVYRSGYHLEADGDVHTEKHLRQLISKNLLEFHNNNWFECYADWELRDDLDFGDCVSHSPKEGLNCAIEHLLALREELKQATNFNDDELWEK